MKRLAPLGLMLSNGIVRSHLARADMELGLFDREPGFGSEIGRRCPRSLAVRWLCAWTYLNDHPAAHDIMDHAVENASGYIARYPDFSDKKLLLRIKSVLRRRARQIPRSSVGRFCMAYLSIWKTCMLFIPRLSRESMLTNSTSAFPRLHNQLWTGVRWIILGGRSLQRSSWTTPQSGVRLIERWSRFSKISPSLEKCPNVAEIALVLSCRRSR